MRKPKAIESTAISDGALHEQIARKAYALYEQRGGDHGQDLDDWLTAERLIQEISVAGSPPQKAKSKVVSMKQKKAYR